MKLNFPLGTLSHIGVVDNFLSETICLELVDFCKLNYRALFNPGEMMGGVDVGHKKSFDWPIIPSDQRLSKDQSEFILKIDNHICEKIKQAIGIYRDVYDSFSSWTHLSDTGYRIQHYPVNNGYYKSHIDGAPWLNDGLQKRTLAGIIYLNTVSEGGGTYFDHHHYTVDSMVGRLAIFPAHWTHPHGGLVPVSEDKWIISTFFC